MVSICLPAEHQPEVRVVVRWEGPQATWREIVALRHVVPELANLSLVEVRERVGNAAGWELGIHPRGWAQVWIVPVVEKNGLRAELIEIPIERPSGSEDEDNDS